MLRAEKPGYARTRLRKGSGHSMKSNYLCMKLTNSEARKHSHRDTHKHTHVSWAFLSSNSNRLTTVSQVLRKTVQCLISRIFSLRQQKWMSWQKVFCGLLHGRTAGCSGVLNDPKNPQNDRFQSISYFFWCSACCILSVINYLRTRLSNLWISLITSILSELCFQAHLWNREVPYTATNNSIYFILSPDSG